jgi:diguanylate cyclase (GGDEF)-like protein
MRPGTTHVQIIAHRIAAGFVASSKAAQHINERTAMARAGTPTDGIVDLTDGRTLLVSARPMANGGWVTTHEDITARRQAEVQIAHMAHHDALTGLPNRVLLRERLDEAIAHARRGSRVAVLYLDLDHFKSINDTLGHGIGDELLKAVASRLRTCLRETDTIARLGGDEFAIIQGEVGSPSDVATLASRIRDALNVPYGLDGHQVPADVSIGISLAPDDTLDPEQLLKNADMALYRSKADGRGTFRFFEPQMDERVRARRTLELDLRNAIANREFELYYQPVVNLERHQISACETLLRWHHPTRGMVPPAEFIPVAEETGLINQIGEWVLRQACLEAMSWPDDIAVAVNLSPVQFKNQNLALLVASALADSGLPARRLELEITEAVLLLNNEPTLATLHQLRDLGVRIAMDDFGTGYSSLSYLRSFPFDKIKIDRSFINDIADKDESGAIVQAVTALATRLKMATTAEGVETQEQLQIIQLLGCTEMQGYLYSRPVPADGLIRLLMPHAEQRGSAA